MAGNAYRAAVLSYDAFDQHNSDVRDALSVELGRVLGCLARLVAELRQSRQLRRGEGLGSHPGLNSLQALDRLAELFSAPPGSPSRSARARFQLKVSLARA
jgi:hypothetical protein